MKGPAFQIGDVVMTSEGKGTIVAVDVESIEDTETLYRVVLFGRNKLARVLSEDELTQE